MPLGIRFYENLHPLYKRYSRDIYSQACTDMPLVPRRYFRRLQKDIDIETMTYINFGVTGQLFVPAKELVGTRVNCYNIKCFKSFIFTGESFPVVIICDDCNNRKNKKHNYPKKRKAIGEEPKEDEKIKNLLLELANGVT